MPDTKLTAELLDDLDVKLKAAHPLPWGEVSGVRGNANRELVEVAINALPALIAAARASLESRDSAASLTYACDGSHGMSHHDPACGWVGASMPYGERCPVCRGHVVSRRQSEAYAAGAELMAGWVKPEERRPHDNQKVLVCNSYGEARVGSYDSSTGDVLFRDGFWHLFQCTHWRPAPLLPSPPKVTP
jgi:hypothetical protein